MDDSKVLRQLLELLTAAKLEFLTVEQAAVLFKDWIEDSLSGEILTMAVERELLSFDTNLMLKALSEKLVEVHEGDEAATLQTLGSDSKLICEIRDVVPGDLAELFSFGVKQIHDQETEFPTPESAMAPSGVRFQIIKPHAEGGFGKIFIARDAELRRDVAIKELQDKFADREEIRNRFVHEAQVASGLEHPGIVPIYGLGQYADGRPFYVMRFLRGESLQSAIINFHRGDKPLYSRRQDLAFRDLISRVLDVCKAVGFAHSKGILHRDLKPGNVILGEHGETLVIDWGLAKRMEAVERGITNAQPYEPTMYGTPIGTPAYMSPEQARGNLDELGPRTDVYSLGAILYTILTGRPPFSTEANNKNQNQFPKIIKDVRHGRLLAPSAIAENVPPPLESICLRAMSSDPSHRYESVSEFQTELECWLADGSVLAHKENLNEKVARVLRNTEGSFAKIVAVVFFLMAIAFALAWITKPNAVATIGDQAGIEEINEQYDNDKLSDADFDRYGIQLQLARKFTNEENYREAHKLIFDTDPVLRGFDFRLAVGRLQGYRSFAPKEESEKDFSVYGIHNGESLKLSHPCFGDMQRTILKNSFRIAVPYSASTAEPIASFVSCQGSRNRIKLKEELVLGKRSSLSKKLLEIVVRKGDAVNENLPIVISENRQFVGVPIFHEDDKLGLCLNFFNVFETEKDQTGIIKPVHRKRLSSGLKYEFIGRDGLIVFHNDRKLKVFNCKGLMVEYENDDASFQCANRDGEIIVVRKADNFELLSRKHIEPDKVSWNISKTVPADGSIDLVALSPNGDCALSRILNDDEETLQLVVLNSGDEINDRRLGKFPQDDRYVPDYEFSPDGRYILRGGAWSQDGTLVVPLSDSRVEVFETNFRKMKITEANPPGNRTVTSIALGSRRPSGDLAVSTFDGKIGTVNYANGWNFKEKEQTDIGVARDKKEEATMFSLVENEIGTVYEVSFFGESKQFAAFENDFHNTEKDSKIFHNNSFIAPAVCTGSDPYWLIGNPPSVLATIDPPGSTIKFIEPKPLVKDENVDCWCVINQAGKPHIAYCSELGGQFVFHCIPTNSSPVGANATPSTSRVTLPSNFEPRWMAALGAKCKFDLVAACQSSKDERDWQLWLVGLDSGLCRKSTTLYGDVLTFLENSSRVIVGTSGGTLQVWEPISGRLLDRLSFDRGVSALAVNQVIMAVGHVASSSTQQTRVSIVAPPTTYGEVWRRSNRIDGADASFVTWFSKVQSKQWRPGKSYTVVVDDDGWPFQLNFCPDFVAAKNPEDDGFILLPSQPSPLGGSRWTNDGEAVVNLIADMNTLGTVRSLVIDSETLWKIGNFIKNSNNRGLKESLLSMDKPSIEESEILWGCWWASKLDSLTRLVIRNEHNIPADELKSFARITSLKEIVAVGIAENQRSSYQDIFINSKLTFK